MDGSFASTIKTLIDVMESGTFYATAVDEHACHSTDSIVLVTKDDGYCFIIPNLITPNNDASNQFFEVGGIRLNLWNLEIYNRWGDKVYQSKGYNNDWQADGVGDGLYYYHLENPVNKVQTYKGWIQVVDKH
jgi:gliding motility-associated-like protein